MIKRRPEELLETFNTHAGHMCISSITLTELIHGVEKSSLPERNRRNVEDFVSRLEVLNYDDTAAAHYGDIRANLERKGAVIGVNDLHIAGHARSQGLILVTNNTKEFERVEGLRLENWTEKYIHTRFLCSQFCSQFNLEMSASNERPLLVRHVPSSKCLNRPFRSIRTGQ